MDTTAQAKVRVAINGFGRIGRNAFKVALEEHPEEVEIVAINDLTEPKVLAHLLEYDTAYGHWDKNVSSDDRSITINGQNFPIYAEKDPTKLPWEDLNVDVVIESTGRFTNEEGMRQHLAAGAKRVVLSAPAKGNGIGTFLVGVNHDKYQSQELVNNGSCTTNCIAPIAAIIHEKFGIQKALMTTVHSVTAEQNLVDGPPPGEKSNDLRRARAAYANIIPTSTGAAIAVTQAIPELKGLFDGQAIRVPTIVGSISDFTFLLAKKTTLDEVKQAIKEACESPRWKGIVAWSEEPLVSSDIIGRSESSIVDLPLTQLMDGDLLKIFAWYDNEWGYSNRLIEMVIKVGQTASAPAINVNSAPSSGLAAVPASASAAPIQAELSPLHSRPTTHNDYAPPPALPPLTAPSPPAPSHQPATFFAQDHPASSAPAKSDLTPILANLTPVASPASNPPPTPVINNGVGPTSLPLIPAQNNSAPPPSGPTPEVATALNMPQSPHPASTDDKEAKPEEPKIEDHVLPEGTPPPKNNPFLSWFK